MESSQLVTILHYGGIGCLVLAALLLALAILLFFRLRIREIRDELSGKARENAISEMGENYSTTGTLRTTSDEIAAAQDEKNGLMNTGQLDKKSKKSGKSGKKKAKQQAPAPQRPPVPQQTAGADATDVLVRQAPGSEATDVLTGQGSEATDVLTRRPPQKPPTVSVQPPVPPEQQPTAPLRQKPPTVSVQPPVPPEQQPTAPLRQNTPPQPARQSTLPLTPRTGQTGPTSNPAFRITKEIILVHTDDQIP